MSPALVALRAAGLLPELGHDLAATLDGQMTPIATALVQSGYAKQIVLNDAASPAFEVPCVLHFSREDWVTATADMTRASTPPRVNATWHEAIPTADGSVILAPNINRSDAAAFYTVVRDRQLVGDRYRVAVARRVSDDEVVWEGGDNRCTLVRYLSGALRCDEVGCDQACGGATFRDGTGVEHVPCGCPH